MTEDVPARPVHGSAAEAVTDAAGIGNRVALSTRAALAVVGICVLALTVINGVGRLAFGEVGAGSLRLDDPSGVAVVVAAALVPIALTIFLVWSGWWRGIWREPNRVRDARWLVGIPLVILIQVLVALALGAYSEHTVGYLVLGVALCAFVGYTEELLYRGVLVRGLRASGLREVPVLLISSAVFAVSHASNLVIGAPLVVVAQILVAFVVGAALYVTMRVTGLLAVPVVLHAAIDLGMLLAGQPPSRVVNGSFSTMLIALVILVPIAVRRLGREQPAVDSDPSAAPPLGSRRGRFVDPA